MFTKFVQKELPFQKFVLLLTCCVFLLNMSLPLPVAAQTFVSGSVSLGEIQIPAPGSLIGPSEDYIMPFLKGVVIYPEDPFRFDFIVDRGNTKLKADAIKPESEKLIRYFLASLTIPEDDQWVNLSPYEKDQIMPLSFGQTELGRDLLAVDYLLKHLTASLIYPEEGLGQEFWQKVYSRAFDIFGTTEIPINTFNKVWIVPDKATVYESGNTVVVLESRMKVMLEEDYLSMNENMGNAAIGTDRLDKEDIEKINNLSHQIVRDVLLPAIEEEVNTGKNFAQLRQMYNSMILATWYKKKLRTSLLSLVYADQGKTSGVDTADKEIVEKIYEQYLDAFQQGVYNFIKPEFDPFTKKTIPRKYFSGGFTKEFMKEAFKAETPETRGKLKREEIRPVARGSDYYVAETNLRPVNVRKLEVLRRFLRQQASRAAGRSVTDTELDDRSMMASFADQMVGAGWAEEISGVDVEATIGQERLASVRQTLQPTQRFEPGKNVVVVRIKQNQVEAQPILKSFQDYFVNVEGDAVQAINFQVDQNARNVPERWKGKGVVVIFENEWNQNRDVRDHELMELSLVMSNPQMDWSDAHDRTVEALGRGQQVDRTQLAKYRGTIGANIIRDTLNRFKARGTREAQAIDQLRKFSETVLGRVPLREAGTGEEIAGREGYDREYFAPLADQLRASVNRAVRQDIGGTLRGPGMQDGLSPRGVQMLARDLLSSKGYPESELQAPLDEIEADIRREMGGGPLNGAGEILHLARSVQAGRVPMADNISGRQAQVLYGYRSAEFAEMYEKFKDDFKKIAGQRVAPEAVEMMARGIIEEFANAKVDAGQGVKDFENYVSSVRSGRARFVPFRTGPGINENTAKAEAARQARLQFAYSRGFERMYMDFLDTLPENFSREQFDNAANRVVTMGRVGTAADNGMADFEDYLVRLRNGEGFVQEGGRENTAKATALRHSYGPSFERMHQELFSALESRGRFNQDILVQEAERVFARNGGRTERVRSRAEEMQDISRLSPAEREKGIREFGEFVNELETGRERFTVGISGQEAARQTERGEGYARLYNRTLAAVNRGYQGPYGILEGASVRIAKRVLKESRGESVTAEEEMAEFAQMLKSSRPPQIVTGSGLDAARTYGFSDEFAGPYERFQSRINGMRYRSSSELYTRLAETADVIVDEIQQARVTGQAQAEYERAARLTPPTMEEDGLYRILGLSRSATSAEVQKAYRQLALKYHPDKNPGDVAAELMFKAVNEAASVLGDHELRRIHDTQGPAAAQRFRQRQGRIGYMLDVLDKKVDDRQIVAEVFDNEAGVQRTLNLEVAGRRAMPAEDVLVPLIGRDQFNQEARARQAVGAISRVLQGRQAVLFSGRENDLFGFPLSDNEIALSRELEGQPIGYFHEGAEAVRGDHLDFELNERRRELTVFVRQTKSAEPIKQDKEAERITLKLDEEAFQIARAERTGVDAFHYQLRAFQRMVFKENDLQLTDMIRGFQGRETSAPVDALVRQISSGDVFDRDVLVDAGGRLREESLRPGNEDLTNAARAAVARTETEAQQLRAGLSTGEREQIAGALASVSMDLDNQPGRSPQEIAVRKEGLKRLAATLGVRPEMEKRLALLQSGGIESSLPSRQPIPSGPADMHRTTMSALVDTLQQGPTGERYKFAPSSQEPFAGRETVSLTAGSVWQTDIQQRVQELRSQADLGVPLTEQDQSHIRSALLAVAADVVTARGVGAYLRDVAPALPSFGEAGIVITEEDVVAHVSTQAKERMSAPALLQIGAKMPEPAKRQKSDIEIGEIVTDHIRQISAQPLEGRESFELSDQMSRMDYWLPVVVEKGGSHADAFAAARSYAQTEQRVAENAREELTRTTSAGVMQTVSLAQLRPEPYLRIMAAAVTAPTQEPGRETWRAVIRESVGQGQVEEVGEIQDRVLTRMGLTPQTPQAADQTQARFTEDLKTLGLEAGRGEISMREVDRRHAELSARLNPLRFQGTEGVTPQQLASYQRQFDEVQAAHERVQAVERLAPEMFRIWTSGGQAQQAQPLQLARTSVVAPIRGAAASQDGEVDAGGRLRDSGGMETPGGIDLSSEWLDLQTEGGGLDVTLPDLDTSPLGDITIEGLEPFIFNISPLPTLTPLLGAAEAESDDVRLSAK